MVRAGGIDPPTLVTSRRCSTTELSAHLHESENEYIKKNILMKVISASNKNATIEAAEVLSRGGVVVYPTDTLYGLGVDATDRKAIEKIYDIKSRVNRKPIHVVVESLQAAEPYVEVTPLARSLAREFFPGALTIVLKAKDSVPQILLGGGDTLGIRVPDKDFCIDLARAFGKPYTTTSANRSGAGNPLSVEDVREMLDENFERLDLVIDGGQLSERKASTMVDATGVTPRIIREGAIPAERILHIHS